MLIGAHESTAGGLYEAFGRAVSDGAEAVQIFTKSNRMWAAKAIGAADSSRFREEGAKSGLLATCTVHASYLINLASEPGEMREKAVNGLADELRRCGQLGLDKLVLHPGSHADIAAGCVRIADGLAAALEQAGRRLPGPPRDGGGPGHRARAHLRGAARDPRGRCPRGCASG